MTETHAANELYVATALNSWDAWLGRASKLFSSLSDEELQAEVTPGKNRAIYILGHLTAVNDRMIPQLRLGEASFPHLRELFIEKPDRTADLPSTAELRNAWEQVGNTLSRLLHSISAEEWLERHATVSEEDFQREPHRNRLAILLSRTSHISYHVGQLILRPKA